MDEPIRKHLKEGWQPDADAVGADPANPPKGNGIHKGRTAKEELKAIQRGLSQAAYLAMDSFTREVFEKSAARLQKVIESEYGV